MLSADGRPDEAETTLQDLLARLKALEAEYAGQPQHRYDLARAHATAARGLMEVGRHKDAEKPCRRALALYAELRDDSPEDAEYLEHVAGEHDRLAKILTALDRRGEAEQSYRRAVPLYGKLAAAEGPRKEALRFAQASSQNNVAWVLVSHTDPKWRKPDEAVKAAKEATDLVPKAGDFWNTLGLAHYRAGDWKAAAGPLEKSMELRMGGDSFDWFFLAMTRWQLGEKEAAREWYARAVQWMERHRPNDVELVRFRAEADVLINPLPGGKSK